MKLKCVPLKFNINFCCFYCFSILVYCRWFDCVVEDWNNESTDFHPIIYATLHSILNVIQDLFFGMPVGLGKLIDVIVFQFNPWLPLFWQSYRVKLSLIFLFSISLWGWVLFAVRFISPNTHLYIINIKN